MTTVQTQPRNAFTGKEYSGDNQFKLTGADEWATFLQWHANGFKIRKGEHGTTISRYILDEKKDKKTGQTKEVEAIRKYTVFNRGQVEVREANEV
jgi:antirestriction protein ArdC